MNEITKKLFRGKNCKKKKTNKDEVIDDVRRYRQQRALYMY